MFYEVNKADKCKMCFNDEMLSASYMVGYFGFCLAIRVSHPENVEE